MKKETNFLFWENSLDIIRLLAALQVAVSHYLNLTLLYYKEPGITDTLLLGFKRCITLFPGVVILFTISGFLLGATLERGEDRMLFLKKRFFRIFPALWICILWMLLLVFAVVRPSASEGKTLFVWSVVQALGVSYTPDFLKEFGAGSINGALWTVMVEIQLYLLLFLFFNWLKRRKDLWWHGMLVCAFGCNLLSYVLKENQLLSGSLLSLLDRTFVPYLCWFVLGLYLYRFREKAVPFLVKHTALFTVIFVIYKSCLQYFGWAVPGYYGDIVTSLMLPCIVIGWGYKLGRHRLKLDLSYGIFLFHWPFINLVFHYDLPKKTDHILLFMGYLAAFTAMAAASWYFLERRILKRK